MKTGAFAMFDALGTREVWRKHDANLLIQKFEWLRTEAQRIVERDFGGPGLPNTKQAHNFVESVNFGFISDTIVVGFVNKEAQDPVFTIMMAARYAGEISRLALEDPAPWSYRGVITYGEFAIHKNGNFFLGPAVNEAASLHEKSDGAFIWLAPSANDQMVNANEGHYQGAATRFEHDVPMKTSGSVRTRLVSPFPLGSDPRTAKDYAQRLLETFNVEVPDVLRKKANTETFLTRHLMDLKREREALMRRLLRLD